MLNRTIRQFLKRTLPVPVRSLLRACLNYLCRLLRWPIILWQVRGATIRDQWTLVQSAFFSPVISLRELQAWQDPHLLRDALVNVPGVGVFSLRANTDDLWHVVPYREQSIVNLLSSRLKDGDTFIDAGANIGVYTIQAARLVGASGQVISIEMMPDTAERLEAHIRMNDLHNVTLVRRALSDAEGKIVVATVQIGKYGQATIANDSEYFKQLAEQPHLYPAADIRESYRRSVCGSESVYYRIAADYDCILRLFSHPEFKAAYIPEVLVTMRVGGASNRSLRNVIRKSREDYQALRANVVGGPGTLAWKNVSKVAGFDVPIWWWFCDAGVGKGGILPAVAGGLS